MNLHRLLLARAEAENPIRVGVIGAGKFATMFFSQALRLPGVHLLGVVDLAPDRARANLAYAGWPEERYAAASLDAAAATGATHVGEDWRALAAHPEIDIVIEVTGSPVAAVDHILGAIDEGKHVINVTVEADAYLGAAFAASARAGGVVYSMAYGDQPALVCDLVDWARACGFNVVAAGRGHKWLPEFRKSTPETVWNHWGVTAEQAERGRLNPKMFNAFLDGSKPAIESAAIANACGLDAPAHGLAYPPAGAETIADVMKPRDEGGLLEKKGMVEVLSSLWEDGAPVAYDIRQGVWVAFEAADDYQRHCFQEYTVRTDASGRYCSLYKRWHLIGLELGVSVASVGARGEPTGVAEEFRADVAASAKRDLKAGEILDGEGGFTVSGALRPASLSLREGLLPLGLAEGAKLVRDVPDGALLKWSDVELDQTTAACRLRQELEQAGADA